MSDFSYTANYSGYWIYYKGHRIFGAGTNNNRKIRKNLILHRQQAIREVQRFVSGHISPDELSMIQEIDAKI